MPAAFREARFLGHDRVVDDAQPPVEERTVRVDLGEPVVRLEQLPHVPPGRAKRRARQLLRLQPAVAAVAALAQDEARIAELLDPELVGSTRASGRAPRRRPRAGRGDRGSTPSRSRSGRPSRCGAGTRRSPSLPASCAGARQGRPDRAPRRSGRRRTRPARARPASPARRAPRRRRRACRRPGTGYALSGETTYGGLATTRSNCSPSTGSKKLPCRVSMLSAPLSAALNAA